MKLSHKIILSSIAAGIFLWVLDAAVDFYVFSSGTSFADSLIFEVSLHECYFRIFALVSLVVFGVIISRIVSKQEDLENLLIQAKNDWEETFDSITDVVTIHDRDFNIIRANRAAGKILDIPLLNNSGNAKCYECYHGENSAPEDCPSCECFSTGLPAVYEKYEPYLRKFIEIRTMPRFDKKKQVTGLIHVVRDITEKKELQQFLTESEERFRALFNQASDCIFLLDPTHENGPVIVNANEAACRMHGYSWEELLGQPITILDAPESRKEIPGRVKEILSGQHVTFEIGHVRKNGSVFPVEVSAQLITISGKSYILAIDRDITERKETEQELKRHREQLMELVRERTSELQYAVERLEQEIEDRKQAEAEAVRASHLAALGELAAGVAHEINNPINGIINYSQILANRHDTQSVEHDIASRIIKEGDRIASIVKGLLSFARDSRQEKRPVRLSDIVTDSLALTEAHLRKDNIMLKVNVPDDLPMITAQPHQIEQVFLNIISNARYSLNEKRGRSGDIKLLDILAESIIVQGEQYNRITFYDTGTGIPANIRDKVMNPFFTTKPSNIGTGLGLSISHGIISDHGGAITIDSAEGSYTKIIIELPAEKNAEIKITGQDEQYHLKK
ncbi:MAG: PAS domain S-box protein [Nitrospiraceae bacterium]|nr:MAG: PAS domain S-box protein [Nitrospiraceae bacterium]